MVVTVAGNGHVLVLAVLDRCVDVLQYNAHLRPSIHPPTHSSQSQGHGNWPENWNPSSVTRADREKVSGSMRGETAYSISVTTYRLFVVLIHRQKVNQIEVLDEGRYRSVETSLFLCRSFVEHLKNIPRIGVQKSLEVNMPLTIRLQK
jgi:hypothetical protein